MIVNPNGSVYAIKISDFDVMDNQINGILRFTDGSNKVEKLKRLDALIKNKFDTNPDMLEEVFLEQFGFFGFDLYKSNVNNLENWSKYNLTIDNFNQVQVEEDFCK